MGLTDAKAAQYALLAAAAEAMYDGVSLTPPLPASVAAKWTVIGYLSALDAIFGAQALGLGNRVYYGFVAHSIADPTQVVVVIRGTEAAIEWMEDIEGALIPTAQGMVHHGFASVASSMELYGYSGGVPYALTKLISAGATVTFIGHSLGAAIATYQMGDVSGLKPTFNVRGAIFASPRPGDGLYCRNVDKIVGSANYNAYAYIRDIVPHVPPSLPFGLGFQSLPNTRWISPATAQVSIQNTPACNHSARSYAAMLDLSSVTDSPCIIPPPRTPA